MVRIFSKANVTTNGIFSLYSTFACLLIKLILFFTTCGGKRDYVCLCVHIIAGNSGVKVHRHL